ncbi:probable G-protein coupled receptor 156 [Pseudophryne corroboree]|uniref:probable G-protein coupled receptor 156 n=1 Tax=Pseudophryne corroboree TaxID=495146 RepID=UPI003081B981
MTSAMEPTLNCSLLSESHIDTSLDRTEALWVLLELCRLSRAPDTSPISDAVHGVLGTLLTCGLLLSLFFFIFTVRFRRNRIVKMSSPNLNLVTVLGSVCAYISAFMFAVQENASSVETVMQVRISLLYVGVTLVFGPLLGKSWRLHRVFTHRVPDKRVIIKDLTLLGLEAGLLFVDALLLLSWVLSDPVLCTQNVSASITAARQGTFCAVTRTRSCSSLYADFWIALLVGFKGVLLVYSSYLAGLTRNISTPPVNQSLVIMVGSSLAVVCTAVVFLVTRFFHTWPGLVYGTTSGSILVCTITINGLIFIPQLLQWRQFEEEPSQTNVQMAKYFNSPSKSMRSMYSEEQIYQLLGENTSMRRLLTEKNAVIESLQEQVTNAKEKLVQLLNSECSVIPEAAAIAASTLALQQHKDSPDEGTDGESKGLTKNDPEDDTNHRLCVQPAQGYTTSKSNDEGFQSPSEEGYELRVSVPPSPNCSILKQETEMAAMSRNVSFADGASSKSQQESTGRVADEAWEQLTRKVNYVSSEKLQDILRELSIETLSGCGKSSPRRQRRSSHSFHGETAAHPSEGFRNVCLSLSPYITRRRRGHGYGCRNVARFSQNVRPMPPHAHYFINQGSRDRSNDANVHRGDLLNPTPEIALDETYGDRCRPSAPTRSVELCFQAEERDQGNGGVWITKLSDRQNYGKGSSRITHWAHLEPDPRDTYRSQTPFSDSDSSSSEEALCFCHRPYCDICSVNTCESSDSCNTEMDEHLHGWPRHPNHSQTVINFNEDLQPTFV